MWKERYQFPKGINLFFFYSFICSGIFAVVFPIVKHRHFAWNMLLFNAFFLHNCFLKPRNPNNDFVKLNL